MIENERIRVFVADTSPTGLRQIMQALEGRSGLEVAGSTHRLRYLRDECVHAHPDVVIMGLAAGCARGLDALQVLASSYRAPVLVITGPSDPQTAGAVISRCGLAAVERPADAVDASRWGDLLESRARCYARAFRRAARPDPHRARTGEGTRSADAPRLFVIGASTGGPRAVRRLLRALPASFALPTLVAIHLPDLGSEGFTTWLDGEVPQSVRFAEHCQSLPPAGTVVIAPPARHLIVQRNGLRVDGGPAHEFNRPSIDILFISAVQAFGGGVVAALLSGMGADGACGLAAIRRAGGTTLIQDRATSVIFGMPGAAKRLGAAQHELSPDGIARVVSDLARPAGESMGRRGGGE